MRHSNSSSNKKSFSIFGAIRKLHGLIQLGLILGILVLAYLLYNGLGNLVPEVTETSKVEILAEQTKLIPTSEEVTTKVTFNADILFTNDLVVGGVNVSDKWWLGNFGRKGFRYGPTEITVGLGYTPEHHYLNNPKVDTDFRNDTLFVSVKLDYLEPVRIYFQGKTLGRFKDSQWRGTVADSTAYNTVDRMVEDHAAIVIANSSDQIKGHIASFVAEKWFNMLRLMYPDENLSVLVEVGDVKVRDGKGQKELLLLDSKPLREKVLVESDLEGNESGGDDGINF